MSTQRHNDSRLFGSGFFHNILLEGFPAGAPSGALRHGWTRAVKAAQGKYVDFPQQVGHRTGRQLLLQLLVCQFGSVATFAIFNSVGPLVEGGAIAAIAKTAELVALGIGTAVVEVSIAGGIGDYIGHGHAEFFMHRVGHGVPIHVLTTGRVPGHNDGFQVGERIFLRQSKENLVHQIETVQRGDAGGGPAGTPTVSVAAPADFVLSQLVVAVTLGGSDAGHDQRGIVESACQECRSERTAKVIIGIAARAVNHNQRPGNGCIACVERVRAIDEGAGRPPGQDDPLSAIRNRSTGSGAGRDGGGEKQQDSLHLAGPISSMSLTRSESSSLRNTLYRSMASRPIF